MSSQKRMCILQTSGLVVVFIGLEWVASSVTEQTSMPYAVLLLAYILPTLPLFGIIPISLAYFKNNPDAPLSSRRIAPMQRYMLRLGTSMFLYIVFLMASVAALNRFDLSVQIKALLAMLTALPIGGVIWAMARLMADPDVDEFERMIMKRSVLTSTVLILFFATLWGFLENFAKAPDFPLYLMVPVFFGLFGLVQPFVRRAFK